MEFTLAFKGVSDLRDEHERIEITPEQASELAKCVKDPIYFIKNYVYINTKDKGVQKFNLWNYQEDLIRKFDKYRFNIVKFGRQLGKSATTRAFILWYSIFNADKVVAILSNKLSGSMEQMYLLRESYLKLPKFLQPGIVSWNKKSIEFSTGTRIFCAATSSDSITGTSVNLLYLDEFALVPHHKADDFVGSVFPTISSGQTTKIIITSTPRGHNIFFRLWEEAGDTLEQSRNGFVRSAATWQVCPTRTKEWAEREMQQIGEIKFNQEHLCSFIGSVSTLIDHKFLSTMKARDPIKLPGLIKYVRLYELPLKRRVLETNGWEYVASLDSGYGVHKDSSVLQICLVKNNIDVEQVAVVSCNSMDIKEFSQMCREVLKQYYDPGLIIEQNGPGIAAIKYFNDDFEYENLIHFDTHGNKLGLWASENLKSTSCILMKTYIQRKYAKIYDYNTINELYSFGQTSATKWGAMGGTHDDHVTSLMYIFLYLQSGLFYGNVVDSGDLGYSLGVDINEEVKISNKAAMLRLASDQNALADEFNAAADYKVI